MREEIQVQISTSPPSQVDLSDMSVTDAEIEEIANEIIKLRPDVVEIYLNNNEIGDAGGVSMAKAFEPLKQLAFIDLQFNSIDIAGATAIFNLQKTRPDLRIALFGNNISDVAEMSKIEGQ